MQTANAAVPVLQVPVLQPTGKFAYYADQAEVDRLLASKEAFARYSSSRVLRALRLKVAIPVRVAEPGRPMAYQGVAPGKSEPSRWWWWEHSVYPDFRDSPHRSAGQAALRALRAEKRAAKESSNAERIQTRRA